MKTVKLVATKSYELEMIHLPNGKYRVLTTVQGVTSQSDEESQYEIVSAMFDAKLNTLEKLKNTSNNH